MTPLDTSNERRVHQRYARKLDVEMGPHTRAKTLDISIGGFSAAMLNYFKPGQVIEGHLLIGTERIPFEAQVRWSAENTRFGAHFTQVDPRFRAFTEDITAN